MTLKWAAAVSRGIPRICHGEPRNLANGVAEFGKICRGKLWSLVMTISRGGTEWLNYIIHQPRADLVYITVIPLHAKQNVPTDTWLTTAIFYTILRNKSDLICISTYTWLLCPSRAVAGGLINHQLSPNLSGIPNYATATVHASSSTC